MVCVHRSRQQEQNAFVAVFSLDAAAAAAEATQAVLEPDPVNRWKLLVRERKASLVIWNAIQSTKIFGIMTKLLRDGVSFSVLGARGCVGTMLNPAFIFDS